MVAYRPEHTPQPRARITGLAYLLYFFTAVFAQFLDGRQLMERSNAANVVANIFYFALTLLFYRLFKPVSPSVSLCAALFGIAGCIIATLGLFQLAPASLSPLLFFGSYCLLICYLISKSVFMPRFLGMLMTLAGIGWLVFLLPLPNYLSMSIEILGILAEGLLMLWLVVKGVNVQQQKEQTGR
jgi:Domain of unknown function (DUF4386)